MIPADIYKGLMEAGNDWADKHGAAELLESSLKSLKAKITLEAKEAEGCSMSQAETIALCATEYRQHAADAVMARTEANRARVKWDATKALFESQKAVEYTERHAMRAAT